MAGRWRDGGADTGPTTARSPRRQGEDASGEDAAAAELPRWMRLYLYGMHGVTLDVVLSALRGSVKDRDPKLVGFSSPYLCAVHSLTHLALERVHSQKRRFRGRSRAVFHLLLYPSVYIGLQMLLGTLGAFPEHAGVVSAWQLAVQYLISLYFTRVFHEGLSGLRYHPNLDLRQRVQVGPGPQLALPGSVRFLFFGMHGFLDEVLFTSAFNLAEKSDRTLRGHTSLWSFLMYGSCSFVVEKLYLRLRFGRGWGAWRRLPVYVCFVYAWEFCWGLALRCFGACSWDYSHYPHNVMGLITLLYLPGWVCLSFYQDVLSNVLLRVTCGPRGLDWEDEVDQDEGVNGSLLDPRKRHTQ